jgi:hypothetical protein
MNSVPYPFVGTPQYPGPSMTPGLYGPANSPMAFGQQLQMHSAATPQMQGPAASNVGYGSRFTPNWQSGLPANGPGPLPGAAPRPVTGPMSPMQERFAAGPRTGSWPPAPGGAAVFSSNRPPMPAPAAGAFPPEFSRPRPPMAVPAAPAAPAAGGMMRGLLGMAGRTLMNPWVGAGTAVATMVPWGDVANGVRNAQQGVNDFLGIGQGAPAPMPTPEMAMDAAPPPMAQSLSPYPKTTAMRYPVPMQETMVNQRPTVMDDPRLATPATMPLPMPAPMPAPAPQMQAPAPQGAVWQGQNAGIGDDTRARAMAWLALQQGMR